MINIKRYSTYSYITSISKEIEELLIDELSYIDKNIEMSNRVNSKYYRNPKKILYDKKKKRFLTGLLRKVITLLEKNNIEYNIEDKTNYIKELDIDLKTFEPYPGYNLWSHQILCIEHILENNRCIVQMPTGAGKSLSLATLIKHYPTANVIVTSPSTSITKSNQKTIETIIGEKIGIAGGGKRDYQRVTSCNVDTLYRDVQKNSKLLDHIDILIVDECHTLGNTKKNKLVYENVNNAFMKVGMSATAWRESGDDLYTEGCLGPKSFEIKEEDLQDKGILVNFDFYSIITKDKKIKYPNYLGNGNYDTHNNKPNRDDVYYEMIVNNTERNNSIVEICKEYYKKGCPNGPALILSESIEHSELLHNNLIKFLKDGEEVEYVKGSDNNKKRLDVIERLSNKELKFVVSTRIFNVGVNFPALGLLIIASGGNASSRIIQQLGRVVRSSTGKEKAIVVDFKDLEKYYLYYNYLNRKKAVNSHYPKTLIQEVSVDKVLNSF